LDKLGIFLKLLSPLNE